MLPKPPKLSIIIPSRSRDAPDLKRLLASIRRQSFKDYEVLVETQGNSEEAKAHAALKSQGEILGFFCADNDFRDPDFLRTMVWYASRPDCDGAYTAQYDYVQQDTALSRYFALLGANDPGCWWRGKADREAYWSAPRTGLKTFRDRLPSLGDNGFFIKRSVLLQANFTPETFGSCMCICEDLRQLGHAAYWVVAEQKLWHRTGDSWFGYFKRRWRYVNALYWDVLPTRRWVMVHTRAEWRRVVGFAFYSLPGLPSLATAIRGYRRVPDSAWLLHSPVCFGLTFLYATAWLRSRMRQWSSVRWTGPKSLKSA